MLFSILSIHFTRILIKENYLGHISTRTALDLGELVPACLCNTIQPNNYSKTFACVRDLTKDFKYSTRRDRSSSYFDRI